MYNVHLHKLREKSHVTARKKLLLSLLEEDRVNSKAEGKIANEGRRQQWLSQVLANKKLVKLLLNQDNLLSEFVWKLRERDRSRELTKDGFTHLT